MQLYGHHPITVHYYVKHYWLCAVIYIFRTVEKKIAEAGWQPLRIVLEWWSMPRMPCSETVQITLEETVCTSLFGSERYSTVLN